MKRYETLLLTVPEITQDEISSIESHIEAQVKEVKGAVLSFEKWGKYRLAYPVRNNEYGVYFLVRYEIDNGDKATDLMNALRSALGIKFNDLIMRFMSSKLGLKQSLAYNRPESLEETPSRDVDTFLKENKMEGLLNNNSRSERSASAASAKARKEAAESEESDFDEEESTEA